MGFDVDRFVESIEDFLCPICQDVVECPVQVSNCEHIFCTDCITQWIANQPNCPVDKLPIEEHQLIPTSRFFRNLYNRLIIKCIYGCEEIVEIEMVVNHQMNCAFNPDFNIECDNGCGKKFKSRSHRNDHNCVNYLKNIIKAQQSQLNTMTGEIFNLKQIVMALNACEESKQEIGSLKREGIIKSLRVENVLLAVDRNIFCSSAPYQSISIDACVLELLNSKLIPKAKVLDIGSDSGYPALCMALMLGSEGQVIAVHNVKQLIDQSKSKIKQHFSFLNESHLKFITADGRNGYQSEGPYDIINYGGAVDEVPQTVIEQLKPNGRIVVPLRSSGGSDRLTTIDKSEIGAITKQEHLRVIFRDLE